MRKFVFLMLAAGLVASFGAGGCYYPLYFYPECYDKALKDWTCCDVHYTPRDHPVCTSDGGTDAEVAASDAGESDAGTDDGGPPADEVCPWPCTPTGGAGFGPFPSYVWFGEETEQPPPPLEGFVWESWVDVTLDEPKCATCACIAPTNSNDGCVLPTVWSVESKVCQELWSPSVTPFDPPANWTGSCSSTNSIPEGAVCAGQPCVQSLVVQPPSIAPCVAEPAMPAGGEPVAPQKHMRAIEYVAAATGQTCGPTSNCIAPPPAKYQICFVANDIDVPLSCPEGWTDKHTGWRDVTDERVCSACTCGPHEGASCDVRARVFADDACADERAALVLTSSEGPKCIDLATGTALAGKTAEIAGYQAGTCAPSISELVGELKLERPVTYCCVPPLPPLK